MLKSNICPKCKHNRILVIDTIPDTGEYSTEIRELNIAKVTLGTGWLGTTSGRAGKLGAAVCRACGFTELHVQDPEAIPVDGTHVRELVGPEPQAPFR